MGLNTGFTLWDYGIISMGISMVIYGTYNPIEITTAWWFGTMEWIMTFPSYWECHHPN